MQTRFARLALAALLAGMGTAQQASAQGFSLFEQSACAVGRAGTGVAAACEDGSAMFYNPAALAETKGFVLSVGGSLVAPRGYFVNDTTNTRGDLEALNIPVPSLYAAKSIGSRAAIGLAVFVPYGLETKWPTTFEGRFIGYNAKVEGAYVQPTFAFKASDQFMIGAGVDIAYYKLKLRQRADLSALPITGTPFTFRQLGVPQHTDFADITVEGSDMSVGFHVGALLKPTETFSIGARYLSKVKISTDDGDIAVERILNPTLRLPIPLGPTIPAGTPIDLLLAPQFQAGARLSAQKASTEITLPDQIVAGVAFRPAERLMLEVDYQFSNWSEFDVLDIKGSNGLNSLVYEDYKDTHGVRVGAELGVGESGVLRAGFIKNSAAAPDETVTPNLPEAPREGYTGGLGLKLGGHIRSDFYYMYLNQGKREGRTVDCARGSASCNNGVYSFNAHLFGVGLTLVF